MIFQGISTSDAGIVQYSDGKVLSYGTDPPLITIIHISCQIAKALRMRIIFGYSRDA
ncbi:MAG TPA: hypothetical protein VEL11_00145 [Candidatus Bathyarchaeia archaeon]|nr:hypothetical protein [Candidatus Bathyarchaeia archaeon]